MIRKGLTKNLSSALFNKKPETVVKPINNKP